MLRIQQDNVLQCLHGHEKLQLDQGHLYLSCLEARMWGFPLFFFFLCCTCVPVWGS